MSDTTCTCSANDFCSAGTTTQSHCHPYGDDRWSWEGCHFDANSCYCRPNGCGGAPVPTATPTRAPTAIPTPTSTPMPSCVLNASPNPCTVNPAASTCGNASCCTTTISWTANNNIDIYVSLDGNSGTPFGSSGPGTNSATASWIQCNHTYDFQGKMGGVVKCSRRVTATCPLATATPTSPPQPTDTPVPTLPPGSTCQIAAVAASDGQYADRIYVSWTVLNGTEAQRIDVYQGTTYLTSQSATDPGQWHFTHQNLTCPVTNIYNIYCWKNNNLYGRGSDMGSTLCPTPTGNPPTGGPTSMPRISSTPTPTSRWPSPTPPVAYGAWFQSQDGDVHAQEGISDPLPQVPPKVFSLDGDGQFPGVVSYGTSAYFGGLDSEVSSWGWLARTRFVLRNFHFYYSFLEQSLNANFNGGMPSGDGVYFADGDQTIAGGWELAGGKRIIILVDGNVGITGNILVPYGSSLVLIASGNINFGNNVSQAQGIFLADKKITTGSGSAAFAGEGSFVAGQEIDLGRRFGDIRDRLTPVEKFLFRPDIIINSLRDLWSTSHVWEELAP